MANFTEAYNFLYNCPLRELETNPLSKSPIGEWFEANTYDIFVGLFKGLSYDEAYIQFNSKIAEIESGSKGIQDKKSKITLFLQGLVATKLYVMTKLHTPVEVIGKIESLEFHMDGEVHMSREKQNLTLELIWFSFEPLLPSDKSRNILSAYVNWNARLYEVKYGKRPYQLSIYYPLLSEVISYIYNPDNGFDVVAKLIAYGALFTRPDHSYCLECRKCPEYLRMI